MQRLVAVVEAEVLQRVLALGLRRRAPPAHHGVVVVRAGVADLAALVAVGQEAVLRAAAEGELQHRHAGQVEPLDELGHARRHQPEVLGYHGQRAPELGLQRVEERGAGRGHPLAFDRRRLAGGDGPVGVEAAEVVHAHLVEELEVALEAALPPREAARLHAVPAVERVAPELAGGAEVVRRHARHGVRAALRVEVEEVGLGPHLGAVGGDVDREVAEKGDVARGGVGA